MGVVVGTVTGASGAVSIPQLFTDLPHSFLTQTSVIGGGSGGAGGPPGLFFILLMMFVILMCAVIIGIVAGSIVHLLVLGIAGMAKDTAQDWIQRVMEPAVYERDPKHRWIAAAMRHGFAVGATVGMLEAVCTAVGITQLVVGQKRVRETLAHKCRRGAREKSVEPWYKSVQPRAEVREGRSFNPDEFAIALEQVAAGNAPDDYKDPIKFFARTCFTRALNEHAGMVIRRLSGETSNAAPVLTLVTQFGGGKTHTLTALYHLIRNSRKSATDPGVQALLKSTGLSQLPTSKVAIFVGNAWDPTEGRETPWIDFARQLARRRGSHGARDGSAQDYTTGNRSDRTHR